jgi:hypothetical protein
MNDSNRGGGGGGSIRCCCGSDLLCNGDRFPGEKATVLDSVAKRSVMDRDTIAAAGQQLPALAAGIAYTRHNNIIHTTASLSIALYLWHPRHLALLLDTILMVPKELKFESPGSCHSKNHV